MTTRSAAVPCALLTAALALAGPAASGSLPGAQRVAPVCDAEFLDAWNAADESHGVAAERRPIFGQAARKFGSLFRRNWFPITASTETFCGRLSRFRWFDGPQRENDLNLFLIPEPGSASDTLLDSARVRGWVEPSYREIEAEVTKTSRIDEVTGRRFEFGIFRRPPATNTDPGNGFYPGSPALALEDALLCTHGPWVTEWQSHPAKPEIHPAELLWWAEAGDLVFLHLQDASRRFQQQGDFTAYALYSGRAAGWRPWAAAPLAQRISIAYEVPAGQDRRLGLGTVPLHAERVVDADPAARSRARRQLDEATSLTLVEWGDPATLAVEIGEGCRAPDTEAYRGFVEVLSIVGTPEPGSYGYHLFRLTADGGPPDPLPIELRTAEARAGSEHEEETDRPGAVAVEPGAMAVAREEELASLLMREIPALENVSLAGRFPDLLFADMGLSPAVWQPGSSDPTTGPPVASAAAEALTRYLNLGFFLVDDGQITGTERARLRVALREVVDAIEQGRRLP